MTNAPVLRLIALSVLLISWTGLGLAQGSLTPPGAPAPTMKTLDQVESRIPISALPASIGRSGSYYVVSNLTGTSGIIVRADDVTIDLNGCTLRGGTNSAIDINGVRTNILIRNGAVVGWGQNGITASATSGMTISDVRALSNTGDGIRTGVHSTIENCIALHNGANGILADRGSRVEGCIARTNFFVGIALSNGRGVIARCNAEGNGDGLLASTTSVIRDSTAVGNRGTGIRGGGTCLIEDCITSQNATNGIFVLGAGTVRDCVVFQNGVDGIVVSDSATLTGNTVTLNGTTVAGAGIRLTSFHSRVDGNHFVNNDYGVFASSGGNLIIRNTFRNNSTNVFGTAVNTVGPIISSSGVATNSNPYANISF